MYLSSTLSLQGNELTVLTNLIGYITSSDGLITHDVLVDIGWVGSRVDNQPKLAYL